jgi:hypothetical protein
MLAGCSKEEAIVYGLTVSGLVIRTEEVANFYLAAFERHPDEFVTYKNLRMKGDLLSKGQLQLLGLRQNVKLSKQFYETLDDEGLKDPLESAVVIGINIASAIHSRERVHKLLSIFGPERSLRLIPSSLAAGPCAEATQQSAVAVKAKEARLCPFATCDKRGQCGCLWTLGELDFGSDELETKQPLLGSDQSPLNASTQIGQRLSLALRRFWPGR